MPRFHLHIRNGAGFVEDAEGQELSDVEQARAVAIEGARALLSAEIATGELDLRGSIEVVDERRALVAVVRFRDVVRIRSGDLPPEPASGDYGSGEAAAKA